MPQDETEGLIDLPKMRALYEHERETRAQLNDQQALVVNRAVVRMIHNVHLEARVGKFRFESDEPVERGGEGLAPSPMQYFGAAVGF